MPFYFTGAMLYVPDTQEIHVLSGFQIVADSQEDAKARLKRHLAHLLESGADELIITEDTGPLLHPYNMNEPYQNT